MENKINIAELLKDCPRGMELDCTIYENVTLVQVQEGYDYPIIIGTPNGQMSLSKYGCFSKNELAKCVIYPKGKTTWEGFHRPFEDGDILVHTQNQRLITSIYHNRVTELIIGTHCILWDKNDGLTVNAQICCYPDDTRFATEEEKQKLFDAIKANGYKWNAETKKIEKLTSNKFDITTLVPFESRVLVRDSIDGIEEYDGECSAVWRPATMGVYTKDSDYPFGVVGGCYFRYCIPYEGNEHLLGTTDDCDEYYKNW